MTSAGRLAVSCALALACIALGGFDAAAQPSSRADDPCTTAFEFADTASVRLFGEIAAIGLPRRRLRREHTQAGVRILNAITPYFSLPSGRLDRIHRETELRELEQSTRVARGVSRHIPDIETLIEFTLDSAGIVRDIVATPSKYWPALSDEMETALRRASESGELRDLVGGTVPQVRRRSVPEQRLALFLTHYLRDDGGSVEFAVARLPLVPVRNVVVRHSVQPTYPEPLQDRSGDVLISFIVKEDGSPDEGSVKVIRSSEPEFARLSIQAIRHWRFDPSAVNGCPIRSLVQLPISFRPFEPTRPPPRRTPRER